MTIVWTEYMNTGSACAVKILPLSRKFCGILPADTQTERMIAVGRHGNVLSLSDEPEAGSVEVSPNITAEVNADGELIGIEIIIIGASAFIRDSVLDSVQARLLQLGKAAL